MIQVRSDLKVLKSMALEDGRIVTVGDEVKFVDSISGEFVEARVVKLTPETKQRPTNLMDYISHSAEHKTQIIAFEDVSNLEIVMSMIEENTDLVMGE